MAVESFLEPANYCPGIIMIDEIGFVKSKTFI